MITIELASFKDKEVRSSCALIQKQVQPYREQIQSYFENHKMTAAHYVVLELLEELIKNSIDADAEHLFIEDKSSDKGLIGIFDDGIGFDKEFLGDTLFIDYGEKLAGYSAVDSNKRGKSKLGGAGRGLAESYAVIKNYQGTLICFNRTDGHQGAYLEFHSSAAPVVASDICRSFNDQRQVFSSRYSFFDSEAESEKAVGALLQNYSVLCARRAARKSQSERDKIEDASYGSSVNLPH